MPVALTVVPADRTAIILPAASRKFNGSPLGVTTAKVEAVAVGALAAVGVGAAVAVVVVGVGVVDEQATVRGRISREMNRSFIVIR